MSRKTPLARRFVYVAVFLMAGAALLLTVAHIVDPPARCEDRGGTWHWEGRWCEEVNPSSG